MDAAAVLALEFSTLRRFGLGVTKIIAEAWLKSYFHCQAYTLEYHLCDCYLYHCGAQRTTTFCIETKYVENPWDHPTRLSQQLSKADQQLFQARHDSRLVGADYLVIATFVRWRPSVWAKAKLYKSQALYGLLVVLMPSDTLEKGVAKLTDLIISEGKAFMEANDLEAVSVMPAHILNLRLIEVETQQKILAQRQEQMAQQQEQVIQRQEQMAHRQEQMAQQQQELLTQQQEIIRLLKQLAAK